jgi:hypothetical protein
MSMIQPRIYRINPLLGLVLFIAFFVLAYYLFIKLVVWLYYATPILLIIALIINHKHVFKYFGNLLLQVKRDPTSGILRLIIRMLALPFVSLWLIFSGYFFRKMTSFEQRKKPKEDEYTDYEIIE